MTVSRMLAPWPRRLSAVVLISEPSGLTPPGSVGCSVWASFSNCARTWSHSMGTPVRSRGITAVDSVAVLEVRNDIRAVDGVAGPEQHCHAGDQQHDKADGDPAPANSVHCPAPPPAG